MMQYDGKRYYTYSVKQLLIDYFGEAAVFSMRKPHECTHESKKKEKHVLPLAWQFADEQAVGLFQDANFLIDTVLEDDYIAYISQFGEKKFVYLMFMVTESEPLFHIDICYAKSLINEWNEKGYETLILRVCIDVHHSRYEGINHLNFYTHSGAGCGCALHELTNVNGNELLVFSIFSCWERFYQKLVYVSGCSDILEYECLFAPNVAITAGEEKTQKVLCKGIIKAKAFLESNSPVYIGYQEFKESGMYFRSVFIGDKRLTLSINQYNLISEINISETKSSDDKIIRDSMNDSYGSLLNRVPAVKSIRALDPTQMHAYAVQLEYADDSIRNYYLYTFNDRSIPKACDIQGYSFSEAELKSASIDAKGNLCFANGFTIPSHILFYHSYRQVPIEYTGNVLYQKNGVTVRSVYKLPLSRFVAHPDHYRHWGRPDECFGPSEAWLDKEGKRLSDISLFSIDHVFLRPRRHLFVLNPQGDTAISMMTAHGLPRLFTAG